MLEQNSSIPEISILHWVKSLLGFLLASKHDITSDLWFHSFHLLEKVCLSSLWWGQHCAKLHAQRPMPLGTPMCHSAVIAESFYWVTLLSRLAIGITGHFCYLYHWTKSNPAKTGQHYFIASARSSWQALQIAQIRKGRCHPNRSWKKGFVCSDMSTLWMTSSEKSKMAQINGTWFDREKRSKTQTSW